MCPENVPDVPPGVPRSLLRNTLDQQRKNTQVHVCMDPLFRPVVHRPEIKTRLHGPPGFLHPHQLLVRKGKVLRGQGFIVAPDHPQPIPPRMLLNRLAVYAEFAALQLAEILPVLPAGHEVTGSPGMTAERCQLLLKMTKNLFTMRLLPRLLQRVPADHVAPPPHPVTNPHFLHLEIVRHRSEATGTAQHLLDHLGTTDAGHGGDVVTPTLRQGLKVLLTAHPRIGDKNAPVQLPAPKVFLHPGDRRDICGVTREDPGPHRITVTGHSKSHHDLGTVGTPVLAVTPNPQVVFLVRLEVHTGGVVEDQVHIQVEQVPELPVQCLLDLLLVPGQHVQGPVEMMQGQSSAFREEHILPKPLLVAAELGGRGETAVGHHGEDGPLEWYGAVLVPYRLLEDVPDPELFPESTHRMEGTMLPAVLELPSLKLRHLFQGEAVLNAGQEFLEVLLPLDADASEGADDAGAGPFVLGIPVLLCDLEVLGLGAVLVPAGYGSYIHDAQILHV